MSYSLMVVDDSPIIRSALKRTIDMTQIPVDKFVQAEDGKDALEKLEKTWVDIIFCDIHMPKMNGVELFENLRKSSEFKTIPFVIISTEGSDTRINDLLKKGISGYIRKPFKPEEIKKQMIEIFGVWK